MHVRERNGIGYKTKPSKTRETIINDFAKKSSLLRSETDVLLNGCVTIVSAYLSRNTISDATVPKLIMKVHAALQAVSFNKPPQEDSKPVPAVDIGESVTSNYIVCLEDGRRLKLLKRHLRVYYGMTPAEYRAKWGLAFNYPMVAPNYAKRRSELAKQSMLGTTAKRATR